MKKLLIVAYPFPPTGGAPVKRTLKFLKFLPHYGWRPAVLTVEERMARHPDPSLLPEIPAGIPVYRAWSPGRFFKKKESSGTPTRASAGKADRASGRGGWIRRFRGFLRTWVAIPDAFILWAPFAVARGLRIIRREKVSVIYSTAPPFTDHLVALVLKKITGKPLVVDFRDAWIAEPAKVWPHSTRKRIESRLEEKVIRGADAVISATEGVTRDFRERYPREDPLKFHTITNGYDGEDFRGIRPVSSSAAKLRIVHTGIFRLERSPRTFLNALSLLLKERPQLRERVEVVFVGKNLPLSDGKRVEEYVREFGLEDVVEIGGFVSRRESLAYQKSADLLLLVVGKVPPDLTDKYGIPGKVYDYIASGVPILAITDEGPVSRLVRRTRTGVVAPVEDVAAIKNLLAALLEGERIPYEPDEEEVGRYDFARLARRLADVLDGVADHGR